MEQIEEILNDKFRKHSVDEVLQKMINGEAYDVRPSGHSNSGYCLIVNIKNYPDDIRHGSEYDVSCLKYLMELQFRMDVDILQDCTAQQFNEKIDQIVVSEKLKSFKCALIILMAHGNEDKLQMVDKVWINYRRAVEYKLNDCDALAGKPKLLFIEACQGPEVDEGISYDGPHLKYQQPVKSTVKEQKPISKPKRADVVIIRATHAPIRAARHPKFGTFFIQAICEVLKADAHCIKISKLWDSISKLMQPFKLDSGHQVPMYMTTLSKPFYFYCHGKSAKTSVLIVGGWTDKKTNFDLELVNRNEARISHTLKSQWIFTSYQGFLFNESIIGFSGYRNKEASLLQLHLPTMKVNKITDHPLAFHFMSTCQLNQHGQLVTTGGWREFNGLEEAYLLDIDNTAIPCRELPYMIHGRYWHSVINFNSKIVVTGGWENTKRFGHSCEYLRLDPTEERWVEGPSLSIPRWHHASAVVDRRLFVAGGMKQNAVEFLDDRMQKWQKAAPMKRERTDFPLTVYNDQVFASGGWSETTEFYDAKMDCWLPGPNMTKGRGCHVAVAVPEIVLGWNV